MVLRPRITKETPQFSGQILCFLHYYYAHTSLHVLSPADIYEAINSNNHRMSEISLNNLQNNKVIEHTEAFTEENDSFWGYMITQKGIEIVEKWSDEDYNRIAEGIVFEDMSQNTIEIPASDRIVTLSDNQAKEAKENINHAIEEIEKETFFGNQWVPEKNALIKTLEAGKEYLDSKAIDHRIGMMMLVEPLQRFVEKYKEEAINEGVRGIIKGVIAFLISLLKQTG
ncbi:MAG: hypothetical protein COB46_04895 [Rhodospirillaceae bacterium]|nr:MAG: hypothetical protein COB46_04895 [Rhodospirillaceae bacterium]